MTKTAGEKPTISLFGLGGYTPILNGRGVDQFGGTLGYSSANFGGIDSNAPINNVQFGLNLSNPNRPKFVDQNGVNIYDASQYYLKSDRLRPYLQPAAESAGGGVSFQKL